MSNSQEDKQEIQRMTGLELYESAGITPDYVRNAMEALSMEFEKALTMEGGFFSPVYVEEKIRKIKAGFEEFREEQERLKRIEAAQQKKKYCDVCSYDGNPDDGEAAYFHGEHIILHRIYEREE